MRSKQDDTNLSIWPVSFKGICKDKLTIYNDASITQHH